jgi:hypothetical protein
VRQKFVAPTDHGKVLESSALHISRGECVWLDPYRNITLGLLECETKVVKSIFGKFYTSFVRVMKVFLRAEISLNDGDSSRTEDIAIGVRNLLRGLPINISIAINVFKGLTMI